MFAGTSHTTIRLILALAMIGALALAYPRAEFPLRRTYNLPVPSVAGQRLFMAPALEARAALVIDPRTNRILFAKEHNLRLPLASLTKIMTAIVAMETAPGEERFGLPNESATWSQRDVLTRMLVTSSNSAAIAIAANTAQPSANPETTFVNLMNQKARSLGLSTMVFTNVTGLDGDNGETGGRGDASDVATLLWYGLRTHPELFATTGLPEATVRSDQGTRFRFPNTNQSIPRLPTVLASKTGLTDLAGGNLALVLDVGVDHPVIVVVLGSSEQGRFTDSEKLARATLDYFASDLQR